MQPGQKQQSRDEWHLLVRLEEKKMEEREAKERQDKKLK